MEIYRKLTPIRELLDNGGLLQVSASCALRRSIVPVINH
jgi:hypothetical protein